MTFSEDDFEIRFMKLGETAYTVSWARDITWPARKKMCGTSNTPIKRTRRGFKFIGNPGEKRPRGKNKETKLQCLVDQFCKDARNLLDE